MIEARQVCDRTFINTKLIQADFGKDHLFVYPEQPEYVFRVRRKNCVPLKQLELEMETGYRYLTKFREQTEIKTPDISFQIIPETPVNATYPRYTVVTIVDRIFGYDLSHLPNTADISKQADRFCNSLLKYLVRTHQKTNPYLYDVFHSSQYVYGHTANDITDHFYLVDVDMYVEDSIIPHGLYANLEEFMSILRTFNKIRSADTFPLTTQSLRSLISQLHPSSKIQKEICNAIIEIWDLDIPEQI